MNLHNKKIGIWGFGVVGKAAFNYLSTKGITTTIMDAQELSHTDYELIQKNKSRFITQMHCQEFFKNNDLIITSPGIDLRPYTHYHHKFITELDLFAYINKTSVVAITGTIGKTSITHLLSLLLQQHKTIYTGGNIGIGMLDLLHHNNYNALTVLELSSFQLEHCTSFSPDLAILTNLYPNHLDRHITLENYFDAKYNLIARQKKHQQALVPLELATAIMHKKSHSNTHQGIIHFFSDHPPCLHQLQWLPAESSLFWLENSTVIQFKNNQTKKLLSLATLPSITFLTNWLIITAALSLLDIPFSSTVLIESSFPEHRGEKIATYKGIDIYNDSKSTIMESTVAAVDKLHGKPIILFLGGLSKGVDRTPFLAQLKNKIKHIICFGTEAKILHKAAQQQALESSVFTSLEDAVAFSLTYAQPEDQILFSPGGSSYDLFKDYKERGKHFKNLVLKACPIKPNTNT